MSTRTRVPWAVLTLILLNAVGALLTALDPELGIELGFNPGSPSLGTALASLFLHANLFHLLGNLVFLAAVGPAVEFATSWRRCAAVTMIGGLAGVLAHWGLATLTEVSVPLLGASAGIAALAGYATLRFSRVQVPIWPGRGVPVVAVALVWVALQVIGGMLRVTSTGGTAYAAHLAGFIIGLAAAVAFRAPMHASQEFGHAVLDRMNEAGPGALLAASDRHLAEHPDDVRALYDRAEALDRLGDDAARDTTLARIVEVADLAGGLVALRQLSGRTSIQLVPSLRRFRVAEGLLASEPELATTILRTVAEGPEDDPHTPEALLLLAQKSDGETRAKALRRLTESFSLHGATETARKQGLFL